MNLGDMFLSKFLIDGAQPYLEAGDFTEALACYQEAKNILIEQEKPLDDF